MAFKKVKKDVKVVEPVKAKPVEVYVPKYRCNLCGNISEKTTCCGKQDYTQKE